MFDQKGERGKENQSYQSYQKKEGNSNQINRLFRLKWFLSYRSFHFPCKEEKKTCEDRLRQKSKKAVERRKVEENEKKSKKNELGLIGIRNRIGNYLIQLTLISGNGKKRLFSATFRFFFFFFIVIFFFFLRSFIANCFILSAVRENNWREEDVVLGV